MTDKEIMQILKRNIFAIGQTLPILRGPIGCLLGIMLFDGSREVKEMNEKFGLAFQIWMELEGAKIALVYYCKIDRTKVGIKDGNIVTEGIVVKVTNEENEIDEAKYTFLPEGSRVQIVYDQDKGQGLITRIAENTEKEEKVNAKTTVKENKKMEVDEFCVRVEGWSKPRDVRITDGFIYFGVVKADCHCNTCVNRFVTLIRSMDKRNVSFETGSWGMDTSLRFQIEEGTDPLDMLSSKIGLALERI